MGGVHQGCTCGLEIRGGKEERQEEEGKEERVVAGGERCPAAVSPARGVVLTDLKSSI